ncbi:Holliday junction branch migration protein RuvA [Flagellatimonas centrodinii]|uniref:Holliday junction branch migration protein RuvA n=1 Tax=Flagellatimonas centrodinii TaxID=2806210 RepID=UPI001FED535C|nr:Holliday junction branch migration protein RuvA [Flagellatimonas centrodinii]ULQ46479.1 Holliday junction branch migration protein RuvA [Flagellatimonas centrodinii]
MIGRLTGTLLHKAPPQLLLDVGGVGYEVEAPMSTFYKLPAAGDTITLHTHLTVREDAHLLFGFGSLAERSLFRDLIKVSAIGPKLALAILSGIAVDEFWQAVRAADTTRFSKLPGIGKKTAERLVVEMRDKAGQGQVSALAGGAGAVSAGPLQEARSALTALGYKPAEVDRLTDAVHEEGMRTEQIIQEALKRAAR